MCFDLYIYNYIYEIYIAICVYIYIYSLSLRAVQRVHCTPAKQPGLGQKRKMANTWHKGNVSTQKNEYW